MNFETIVFWVPQTTHANIGGVRQIFLKQPPMVGGGAGWSLDVHVPLEVTKRSRVSETINKVSN